jgi:hypothetical protein
MNIGLNTGIAVLLLPFVVLAQNRAASAPPQQAANTGFAELLDRPRLFVQHSRSWQSAGSGPAIPPGAQAAGFTMLALDSDFTQQLPSNWLGGCPVAGNGAPVTPFNTDDTGHTWWMNIWWANTYQPCNTVQVQDPTYGGLVLDMPWIVDSGAASKGTVIQSQSQDGTTSIDFPPNAYLEYTVRVTPPGDGTHGPYTVLYTWSTNAGAPFTEAAGYEADVSETSASFLIGYSAGIHNWGGGFAAFTWCQFNCGAPKPDLSHFDWGQYHTWGARLTSDGRSDAVMCSYINNVFIGCQDMHPVANFGPDRYGHYGDNFSQRLFLVLQHACEPWNKACLPNGTQQHMYVKSVRVWSCPTWQTKMCNRPVLRGAP